MSGIVYEHKQVIVLRKDLNMRAGKMVAQGAHASMAAILNEAEFMDDSLTIILHEHNKRWLLGGLAVPPSGFKKICVSVKSEAELLAIYDRAELLGIPCAKILDNGATEFKGVKTWTAVAVGPASPELVDPI